MMWEVQKAVLIPLKSWIDKTQEKMPTEELWQVVERTANKDDAFQTLKQIREWNKGKNLHYRVVKVEDELQG